MKTAAAITMLILLAGCESRQPESLHGTWTDPGSEMWMRFSESELLYVDDAANRGYARYALTWDVSSEPWRLEAKGDGYLAGTLFVRWTDDGAPEIEVGSRQVRLTRTEIDWERIARRDRCRQVISELWLAVELARAGGRSRFPDLAADALERNVRCPKDRGELASYGTWASGDLAAANDPATFPVLWDRTAEAHGGERCVAFLDGQARFVEEVEFEALLERCREAGFRD